MCHCSSHFWCSISYEITCLFLTTNHFVNIVSLLIVLLNDSRKIWELSTLFGKSRWWKQWFVHLPINNISMTNFCTLEKLFGACCLFAYGIASECIHEDRKHRTSLPQPTLSIKCFSKIRRFRRVVFVVLYCNCMSYKSIEWQNLILRAANHTTYTLTHTWANFTTKCPNQQHINNSD